MTMQFPYGVDVSDGAAEEEKTAEAKKRDQAQSYKNKFSLENFALQFIFSISKVCSLVILCNNYSIFEMFAGVNFINILRAAFAPVDPKSVKRY